MKASDINKKSLKSIVKKQLTEAIKTFAKFDPVENLVKKMSKKSK